MKRWKRVDIKAILKDPVLRQRMIDGVVRFMCALEGMKHGEGCKCDTYNLSRERRNDES